MTRNVFMARRLCIIGLLMVLALLCICAYQYRRHVKELLPKSWTRDSWRRVMVRGGICRPYSRKTTRTLDGSKPIYDDDDYEILYFEDLLTK